MKVGLLNYFSVQENHEFDYYNGYLQGWTRYGTLRDISKLEYRSYISKLISLYILNYMFVRFYSFDSSLNEMLDAQYVANDRKMDSRLQSKCIYWQFATGKTQFTVSKYTLNTWQTL